MNFNSDSYLYKLTEKYSVKDKEGILNKKINSLLVDFSDIQNEKDISLFCKKYKTSQEEISSIDFIINTRGYNNRYGYEVVNIKYLVFLTNNMFMFDFFNKNKKNFYKDTLGWSFNQNASETIPLDDKQLFYISLYLLTSKIKPFNNTLQTFHDLYILEPSQENENIFIDAIINYLSRSKSENSAIINSLDLIINKKIDNHLLNKFINNNIQGYVSNNKTFLKMAKIAKVNIFQEQIIERVLENSDYFKKCILHFGYEKLDSLFSQVHYTYNRHLYYGQKEPTDNLADILLKQSNLSASSHLIKVLDEFDLLKNIIKKDKEFLNKLFFDCYYTKEKTVFELIDFLEEKYNYNYFFFKKEKNNIIVDKFSISSTFNKKNFITHNINKNSLIPDEVFKDIFSQILYYKDKDLIHLFFENNRLKNNNELYKTLIINFNNDKRKKSLNNDEGLDLLTLLMSKDFKEKYNIDVNKQEELNIFSLRKKNKKIDIIDTFIEKFMIKESLLNESKHNKLEIKRRL